VLLRELNACRSAHSMARTFGRFISTDTSYETLV